MLTTKTLSTTLRTISPHFQRSINLTYDASNTDYIAGYIPTPNGARALATILNNTSENGRQRAHVLHAPYGSGKSLFGLVLNAITAQEPSCASSLNVVQDRLERAYPEAALAMHAFRMTGRRLLPVILSGDEGSLSVALTRALSGTLAGKGLADLRPRTQFRAALEAIALWERTYPDVYLRLDARLIQEKHTLSSLLEGLETIQPKALALFERLYPELTAGARFDPYAGVSLADAFHDTTKSLEGTGYDGIFIIWDEFGRFVETRAGEAFGSEAALLQSFAEFCNRSGSHQVHLVLITHRLLSGYAADLPTEYQQEWARIAERFLPHDITSDPAVTYRLIAETVETTDQSAWQHFVEKHRNSFDGLTAKALELDLFEGLDDTALRQQIIERVWPLHPLAVYALPRLASQVAQNERTLFTFLATDEPNTLQERLAQADRGWWLVRPDIIWDYFAEAIRLDAARGGTHATWSGVMYALSKAPSDDALAKAIVKTLGVLTLVGDANLRSRATYGRIAPTTELLAWAIDIEEGEVAVRLQQLKRRRAVVLRRADGYWTFTRGSDVDLDAEMAAAIEHNTPSLIQTRQLLERVARPPFHLPRGYNQERRMTRFFWGLCRWPNELGGGISEMFLKQLGPGGYADGVVVYVLVTNTVERNDALETLRSLPHSRAIYVVPDRPLPIIDVLNELFALHDLRNDAAFMDRDERLPREVDFFIEDSQRRLDRVLQPLLNPAQKGASWWWHDNTNWRAERVETTRDVSRLLSRLCGQWFPKTPILNSESLNQQAPTGQQTKAAARVIDNLLNYQNSDEAGKGRLPLDLALTGYGPDYLIMRTLLVQPGLLKVADDDFCSLERPSDNTLSMIWDKVHAFLEDAMENEQEVSTLIDKLQSPPFGLRRGVLPILLAAMMWPRLRVLTIRHKGKALSPLTGQDFINLCWHPNEFTVEVGPWDRQHAALWAVLEERCQGFLMPQEREHQPLSYLSRGLLRWLQSRPRYCRDTSRVSPAARQLRDLIYKAQRDPAQVLFYELLTLLEDGRVESSNETAYKEMLATRLTQLIDEIDMAYHALLYELDRFAEENFAADAPTRQHNGKIALNFWLVGLEQQSGNALDTFRFSDVLAQRLVTAVKSESATDSFWDRLSEAVLGLHLQDWNDRSVETFKSSLLGAKERLEREIFELAEDETAVELHVILPEEGERTYRFRPSDLSSHGQRILQNFKSTLEIAGRPLSPDERRQVVLALLHYVLEGPDTDGKWRNKKRRRH